jgi:hypothetical protein
MMRSGSWRGELTRKTRLRRRELGSFYEGTLKMRKANMSAADTAWFYRAKKGIYRRRSPVPATKAVKGQYRKWRQ